MANLPTGTVTFLFTDIEGSTRLLRRLGGEYARSQDDHAEILRKAIAEADGVEVRTEGDAFFAVFASAGAAVRASVNAQRALAAHPWPRGEPLRVRMGLHTGEGVLGGDDYVGIDVHRAARIADAGHGGQIVISDATRAVAAYDLPAGVSIRDLDQHRLKDIPHPERLHDLVIDGLPSEFPPLRTSEAVWNVPTERTAFVGRALESAMVVGLLREERLVTLTGTGGAGKTRLALRVAELVRDDFGDGVVFVDLAPMSDPRLVPSRIAVAAGVREEGDTPIEDTLTAALRGRTLLLILDNIEQIVEAAPAIGALLDAAPGVRALVTSRVRLRLAGEHEVAVLPFQVPLPGRDLSELARNEAVSLFVVRARQADPSFELSEANAAAIGELCARLDGLPLAIELAASRVRVLPPEAILDRLGKRLDLLRGGPRDAPARHETLSEAIRWSDELLEPAASSLLRRLSVFVGGSTLDAADAVANPDLELGADTVDLLEALMEHGLIRRDGDRLRMLETVRTYAAERLSSDPAAQDVRERHARFYLSLAERAERHTVEPATLAEIEADHDNLRASLRWARVHDVGLGLRLGAALWRFWHLRGHLSEGRATLEDLLGTAPSRELPRERAAALVALAGLVYWQNDYPAARTAYEEAAAVARSIDADEELGDAVYGLAFVTRIEGDQHAALRLHGEARRIFERIGDARRLAASTMAHGMVLGDLGDLDSGEASLHEASRLFLELGDLLGAATALGALGQIARKRGDERRAVELYLRSAGYGMRILDDSGIGVALQGLASIAGRRGDHETAILLWAAAEALTYVGGARAPGKLLDLVDPRPAAEAALGAEATERLWDEGASLSAEGAMGMARERLGER